MKSHRDEYFEEMLNVLETRLKVAKAGPEPGDRSAQVTGHSGMYVSGRIYELDSIIHELQKMRGSRRKCVVRTKARRARRLLDELIDLID